MGIESGDCGAHPHLLGAVVHDQRAKLVRLELQLLLLREGGRATRGSAAQRPLGRRYPPLLCVAEIARCQIEIVLFKVELLLRKGAHALGRVGVGGGGGGGSDVAAHVHPWRVGVRRAREPRWGRLWHQCAKTGRCGARTHHRHRLRGEGEREIGNAPRQQRALPEGTATYPCRRRGALLLLLLPQAAAALELAQHFELLV